jgi:pimeloyl-ACP methyl ester carboxylesterase
MRGIDFGNLLRVLYIEKADHTYSILEDRSHLISEIASWLDSGFRSERAAIESPHLIGTNPRLAGILSQPDPESEAAKKTGIVILSSGLLHRVGPFRLHVDLARSMSKAGFGVLRLDQAGRGDSRRSKGLSLAETIQQELDTAADFFRKTSGIDKLVLVGLCSGADDALALAANNENITGLILFDGYAKTTVRYYVHYYLRRVLNLGKVGRAIRRRIFSMENPGKPIGSTDDGVGGQLVEIRNFPEPEAAVGAVKRLMQRGGSFLGVFTGDVEAYYCYEGQLRDCLGAKEYGQAFKEIYLRNAKHTYPIHGHRQLLMRLVTEWCSGRIA